MFQSCLITRNFPGSKIAVGYFDLTTTQAHHPSTHVRGEWISLRNLIDGEFIMPNSAWLISLGEILIVIMVLGSFAANSFTADSFAADSSAADSFPASSFAVDSFAARQFCRRQFRREQFEIDFSYISDDLEQKKKYYFRSKRKKTQSFFWHKG